MALPVGSKRYNGNSKIFIESLCKAASTVNEAVKVVKSTQTKYILAGFEIVGLVEDGLRVLNLFYFFLTPTMTHVARSFVIYRTVPQSGTQGNFLLIFNFS